MPEVVVDGVHKSFGVVEVLKGITMSVERGEVTALIGRSGSGKSTLLRCMNGLESIQKGAITIAGHAVTADKAKLRRLRTDVGIVFQSYNLFPHLSVADNITLAPRIVKKMGRGRGPHRGRGGAGAGRAVRQVRRLSGPAVGRPAAARRHRALARHEAQGDALRRGDVGARPRTHRRGAWP